MVFLENLAIPSVLFNYKEEIVVTISSFFVQFTMKKSVLYFISLLLPSILIAQDSIPEEIATRAIEISPYNALGYGMLVVVLLYISYREYKDRKELQSQLTSSLEHTTTVITIVNTKLDSIERTLSERK